jgi:hypothetical protein
MKLTASVVIIVAAFVFGDGSIVIVGFSPGSSVRAIIVAVIIPIVTGSGTNWAMTAFAHGCFAIVGTATITRGKVSRDLFDRGDTVVTTSDYTGLSRVLIIDGVFVVISAGSVFVATLSTWSVVVVVRHLVKRGR